MNVDSGRPVTWMAKLAWSALRKGRCPTGRGPGRERDDGENGLPTAAEHVPRAGNGSPRRSNNSMPNASKDRSEAPTPRTARANPGGVQDDAAPTGRPATCMATGMPSEAQGTDFLCP